MNRKRKSRIRRVKAVGKTFLKVKGGFRKKLFRLKKFLINSLPPLLTRKILSNNRMSVFPKNKAFKIVKSQVIITRIKINGNFNRYLLMKSHNQTTLHRNRTKITTRNNSIKHQKGKIEKKLTLRINSKTILVINHIRGEVTKVLYQAKKTNHSAR
jgi:hypothetical protein